MPAANSLPLCITARAQSIHHHGFDLNLGERTIIRHSQQAPCLWVGDGQIEFTEHEGHFQIHDADAARRRALIVTDICHAPDIGQLSRANYVSSDERKTTASGSEDASQVRIDFRADASQSISVTVNSSAYNAAIGDEKSAAVIQRTVITIVQNEASPRKVLAVDGKKSALKTEYQRVWLRLAAHGQEHFYGAGEQFSHFDLSGRKFPIWTREQGVGRDQQHPLWTTAEQFGTGYGGDYHTTYFPQASFVSSDGYYFFVSDHLDSDGETVECDTQNRRHGTLYSELDFSHVQQATDSEHPSYVEIMFYGKLPFQCTLLTAHSCTQAVQAFAGLFGPPLHVPTWVYEGAILGLQGGTQEVEAIVQKFIEAGGAVRGLWIQDWVGKFNTSFGQRLFWNWKWDPMRYPNLPELVQRLRVQHNIRTLGYVSPHVRRDGSLYEEAAELGHLVLDGNDGGGQPLIQDFGEFFCGTIDLTSQVARDWFRNTLRRNMIDDVGLAGWMADFSEYIPAQARFANGMTGVEAHNRFPVMWARLNHDLVDSTEKKFHEYLYWMRAGGLGSQKYMQMLWAGDQCQSFEPKADGLASVMPALLSAGISGAGANHFDVGLFTGFDNVQPTPVIRTKELLFRCAELAVFTPVFRTHEGNRPKQSHQFYSDQLTLQMFALYTQAHAALADYHAHVMSERAAPHYLPAFRPMFYFLERAKKAGMPPTIGSDDVEQACWSNQDQYGYGDLLLVAPVVDAGATTRRVLLPPLTATDGRQWLHLPTVKRYDGAQWVTVTAGLGQPPVFINMAHESLPRFMTSFEKLGKILQQISTALMHQGNSVISEI